MTEPTGGPVPPGPQLPPPSPPVHPPGPPNPYYAPQQPQPAYQPPPSKAMANWALALAIIPCFGITWLVAIGLAIAVLVRSREGRNHGKGLAIAALVIAPLWPIGLVVYGVVQAVSEGAEDAQRDERGAIVERSEMSPLELRVGDCFDDPKLLDGEAAETIEGVPCDDPHDFEAYHEIVLPDGAYPGEDEVSASSARECFREFRGFVGVAYGNSTLEPYNLYPTATSWRLLDDRKVTCVLTDPGTKTVGTLRGARH